ncbi:MarR family transcriptional regulator [Streptomyces pseudovenezuelae]|uniref:DNA-binding MarR family transcriptional regulator n=1 Tax=Streptomyces pseudovenezuelae TaxID=67350 RepID=A0ABT6LDP5_9ACTN|nr:MarR family transcriptional regulator [Streptomyces pseudovenezuelae]MDH6213716.1 DNA-binding MarR family transcriptional regulator [Streptomyces pseudovenezuelae]
MTTTTPTTNGRVIGLAHYAGRAVLESVLADHDATFEQQITLGRVTGAPVERDALAEEIADALKVGTAETQGVLDELIAKGLLAAEASQVRLTDAGQTYYAEVSAEVGEISARIYAGIPAEDLAAAGRVLAQVTARANAELAARRS